MASTKGDLAAGSSFLKLCAAKAAPSSGGPTGGPTTAEIKNTGVAPVVTWGKTVGSLLEGLELVD